MERKYAILGGSLKHTMSPPIHKRLFELKGREFFYEIIECSAEELKGKADYFKSLAGYNVTIPHKIDIIRQLDRLDVTAKRYGAVNCIDNSNGESVGYNTDCDGFLQSIRALGADLDESVLLIGCGGVGRMIATECALKGADLTIAVLESDIPLAKKAVEDIEKLCEPRIKTVTLDELEEHGAHHSLLINASPVGMYPKSDFCPVSDKVIAGCDYVFDVIYNPTETLLLRKARKSGAKTMGGMAMLVWQAVSAHEIWDNDKYTDEEIFEIIREMEEIVESDFK